MNKLLVVDLDDLKFLSKRSRKKINEKKICSLESRDWGKKTLINLPKHNKECLLAKRDYEDAIFKLRHDFDELEFENDYFKRVFNHIKWVRIGVVLSREKASKILLRLIEKEL